MLTAKSNSALTNNSSPEHEQTLLPAGTTSSRALKLLSDDLSLEPGHEVGRYLLLSKLGAGAMGVVFRAYDPDLDRQIALKFIQVGSSSGTMSQQSSIAQSWLMQEAQAMAQVAHPNVVGINDVGTLGDHVYLAMELVEGRTMKEWIRDGGYSRVQMLEVLVAAGYGLESAHRAGLVHRDFKPDNVLLGHDGRVCVADFGLVRRHSKYSKSHAEMPKEILGTPSYMSPEQHRGELATALSDQFSYCVSLFEAAYGVRPFLGRNLGEIATAIEGGHLTVPVEGHKVPRWLHQIMMRGLSVDPADRYPSMHALLTDLAYDRRRKFRQWSMGGLAAFLLIGSIGFSEFSAEFEPDACRLEAESVGQIWSRTIREPIQRKFLESKLDYASRAWTVVNDIMEHRVEEWSVVATEVCDEHFEIENRSEGEIELQEECLQAQRVQLLTFVQLLQAAERIPIKKIESVVQVLEPAELCRDIDLRREMLPLPTDPELRVVVQKLRRDLNRAEMFRSMGQYDELRRMLDQISIKAHAANFAPVLAKFYNVKAWERYATFNALEAKSANLKALGYAEAGDDDSLTADIISQGIFINGCILGDASSIDSWVSHAEAHLQRAGDPPIFRSIYLGNRGAAFGRLKRYEESEGAFRKAIAISEQFRGPGHPGTLTLLNNLALTLQYLNRMEESMSYYQKSIDVGERFHGPAHPTLILPLSNLSLLLWWQGKFAVALDLIRQAIKVSDLAMGRWAPESTREYLLHGQFLLNAGKYNQAVNFWRQNRSLVDRKDLTSSTAFRVYSELSDVLLRLGRVEEADEAMRKVDIDRRGPHDGDNWERIFPRSVDFYLDRGQVEKAERVYATMMGFGLDFLREDLDTIGKVALARGNLHLAKEETSAALKMHELAYSRAKKSFPGEDNVNLVPYERALARSTAVQDDWSEAIAWMNKAIEKLHSSLSDSPHLLASAYLQLARIYGKQGDWEGATKAIQAAKDYLVVEEMDPREVLEIADFQRTVLAQKTEGPSERSSLGDKSSE